MKTEMYVNNEGAYPEDVQRSIGMVSNEMYIGRDRLYAYLLQAVRAYIQRRTIAGCNAFVCVVLCGSYVEGVLTAGRLVMMYLYIYTPDANSGGTGIPLYSAVEHDTSKALQLYETLAGHVEKEIDNEKE